MWCVSVWGMGGVFLTHIDNVFLLSGLVGVFEG